MTRKLLCLLTIITVLFALSPAQDIQRIRHRSSTSAPPPTGTDFVTDSFTEGSDTELSLHTPELGGPWVEHPAAVYSPGTVVASIDRFVPTGTPTAYYATAAPATADYCSEAVVHVASIISANAGVAVRMDATADTNYNFRLDSGTIWQLRKISAGVQSTLDSDTSNLPSVGQTRTMTLCVAGSTLTGYVDGAAVVSATDATITAAGQAGIRFSGSAATSTGFHFDSFRAFETAPPPPTDFVVDTFTDTTGTLLTAHTGETGATWTKAPDYTADAVITDANRLRGSTTATEPGHYASGVPTTAEYDVTVIIRVITNFDRSPGPAGRINTTNGDQYLARYILSNLRWELFKEVGGTFTSLGTFTQTLTVGVEYECKLEIRDATKKVFIDGVERISSADNAITAAGRAGIRGGGNSGDTVGYHAVSITASNP